MKNKVKSALTPAEIARVFAIYIGTECVGKEGEKHSFNRVIPKIGYWKLLLTPLSSITDEDMRQLTSFRGYDVTDMKSVRSHVMTWIFCKDHSYEEYQYLISKGYAVPLWFGVDHWANGKTAIELGIAINKTQSQTKT